jgi:outer membrane biosynthesis protein TonB
MDSPHRHPQNSVEVSLAALRQFLPHQLTLNRRTTQLAEGPSHMQADGLVGGRALMGRGSTLWARVVLIVMTVVFVLTTAPARGQEADTDIPLMIQTVPATSGLRFSLDGRTFTSDGNGLALITVSQPGTYTLEVLDPDAKSGVRSEFHRWSDGSRHVRRSIAIETFTRLDAGFEISHLTHFNFSGPDGSGVSADRVESVVLTGSDGSRHELSGTSPRWLKSATTVAQGEGLKIERISYRVTEAVVDGEHVSQPPQEPFVPAMDGEWSIEISPPDVGEDGSGAGREVEVVQPTTTNEPSIDRLVVGLVLAVALLALLCFMLVRRRPATRHAMATAGVPGPIGRDIVPGRPAPRDDARARAKRASLPEDRTNRTTSATPPAPQGASKPAEKPPPPKVMPAPVTKPEVERSAPQKTSAKEEPPRETRGNRPSDNAAQKPPSAPVEPSKDEADIDSYEKLGRRVSSILGSAYESADDVQRAAKDDARELLDRAVAEGAAVRDKAHERSEHARETAQQKADEIVEEAESYADQVREKTRRRVAELEEHLRRHQRVRMREQELRNILAQIEGIIPELRSEMEGSEVGERSKAPFPSS